MAKTCHCFCVFFFSPKLILLQPHHQSQSVVQTGPQKLTSPASHDPLSLSPDTHLIYPMGSTAETDRTAARSHPSPSWSHHHLLPASLQYLPSGCSCLSLSPLQSSCLQQIDHLACPSEHAGTLPQALQWFPILLVIKPKPLSCSSGRTAFVFNLLSLCSSCFHPSPAARLASPHSLNVPQGLCT